MTEFNFANIKLSASWGPDDPEVESIWMLLKDGAKKLEDESLRDEADFWTDRVYKKLNEARNHYMTITADIFHDRPTSEQEATYNSLYAALWSAYKDRLTKLMNAIGYETSAAIFAGDSQYDSQMAAFVKRYPKLDWAKQLVDKQKENWQDTLRDNRNAHEHSGDLRDKLDLLNINNLNEAKKMFAYVSRAIESIGITFMSYKLERMWNVIHVNPSATVFDRIARFEIRFAR